MGTEGVTVDQVRSNYASLGKKSRINQALLMGGDDI